MNQNVKGFGFEKAPRRKFLFLFFLIFFFKIN